MNQALRGLVTISLWALAALPFSPSLAALLLFGSDCFRPEQPGDMSSGSCLVNLTVEAPVGLIFGGLSSDEDPRAILGLPTITVALAFGALGAAGQLLWRSRKAR